MTFANVVANSWNRNHLFTVLLELTYRCNLDCFFCYNDLELTGKAMTREDYFALLEDLARMQVLNLVLSGGEPLAHPEFFAIGARARELGFVVRVKSNGHALRGPMAKRLKREVDPFVVEVSLHGACAETHDRQTRVGGSFDRLMANFGEMQAAGLRLKINSTLTRWNENEVVEMMAIAESFGVQLQFDPEVSPRDDGDTGPLAISPSREGLLRLFRLQAAGGAGAGEAPQDAPTLEVGRQADADLGPVATDGHCGAGAATVTVDPYGNVYPCVQWRRPVGNLHGDSIEEIWSGSADLEEIRAINRTVKGSLAALGKDGGMMGFCPGAAAAATGSPTEIPLAVNTRLELRKQARADSELLPVVG